MKLFLFQVELRQKLLVRHEIFYYFPSEKATKMSVPGFLIELHLEANARSGACHRKIISRAYK